MSEGTGAENRVRTEKTRAVLTGSPGELSMSTTRSKEKGNPLIKRLKVALSDAECRKETKVQIIFTNVLPGGPASDRSRKAVAG
jgi:hypothetical protein